MSGTWTLAVVVGSVREGRIGAAVARWFVEQVPAGAGGGAPVDVVDLAALQIPDDLGGGGDTRELARRIGRADAVVVVTPEYNRGYPGPLKSAVDAVVAEWGAKPVGFVAYGGVSGGLRAVEQLRPVFAELHAVTVQAVVTLPCAWDCLDAHGSLHAPRAERAAATMLGQLDWWARALRDARARSPVSGLTGDRV